MDNLVPESMTQFHQAARAAIRGNLSYHVATAMFQNALMENALLENEGMIETASRALGINRVWGHKLVKRGNLQRFCKKLRNKT